MRKHPKFHIGQTVFSKVARRASSEPTTARVGSQFRITGIHETWDGWEYTCEDFDIYEFKENELMSRKEYAVQILRG